MAEPTKEWLKHLKLREGSKKISYEDIPWEVVEEYGKQDVEITYQLACAQLNKINLKFEEVCRGFSQQ